MTDETASKRPDEVLMDSPEEQSRLWRMLRPLLKIWYVHHEVTLIAYASPAVCLGVLVTSSKPSIERLHLRNLFVHGRRYHFVSGSHEGFQMRTTSKVPWQHRGRTRSTATLTAKFNALDDDLTQINITANFLPINIIYSLVVPIFFTPLFLFAIWNHPIIRILMTVAIYGLAVIAYRYNAAVDAHDMVYFIEKSLEDFMPNSVSELGSHVPHIHNNRTDFPDAWEKFYQAQTDDPQS